MALPLLCLVLAACGYIPRDPEGTADRVRKEQAFHVGLIEGEASRSDDAAHFIRGMAAATGARPRIRAGAAEPLLLKLAAGELDLVIGAMSSTSPWSKKVHVLPALDVADPDEGPVQLVAMARNRENRWIAIAHREALALQARR